MSKVDKTKRAKFIERCEIKKVMRRLVADHFDRRTDEVNYTSLAEATAAEIGQEHRLDDDTDPIWDWALEVGDAYARQHAFKL
jgi:hypothetical protein